MSVYKYRAKKGPQEIVEATIEADSQREAVEKISAMGYVPVRIKELRSSETPRGLVSGRRTGRIRSSEITLFSRQLASLLKSGIPILRGLGIISEQTDNIHFKALLASIHDAVKDGATFSSSLTQYPRVFPNLYVAMIRAGEDTGNLPVVLLRIADYRRKEEETLSRVRMALAYPILMALVGLATIIFMLTFVMPRLMKIFLNMGQSLPLPTRILIATSHFLRQWWVWAILALIILIIRRQARTKAGIAVLSIFKLRFPVLGRFVLKAELSRFCRTLGLLINNGIPVLRAIQIAIPVLDNEAIRRQLQSSYKELEQGGSFGKSLRSSSLFPPFMSNLIIVGEESGRLDEALDEVASIYERDTDDAVRVMSNLLEPLMILGMGLVVGFIVISMLLPIFEINVMVK